MLQRHLPLLLLLETVMRQFLIALGLTRYEAFCFAFPPIGLQDIKPLSFRLELTPQHQNTPQLALPSSSPFRCGSILFGVWNKFLAPLANLPLTVHVSNKLFESRSGSFYVYQQDQSSLTLSYVFSIVPCYPFLSTFITVYLPTFITILSW